MRANTNPGRVLDAASVSFVPVVSDATLAELAETIQRPKFSRYFSPERSSAFLAFVSASFLMCPVELEFKSLAGGACRDSKDDKFLALALAAKAEVIVSSDSDLLILHPWRGIAILTPAEFLSNLERTAK